MFVQQKRDPKLARAELKRNISIFAAAVLAIRASTYLLDAMQSA